MIKKWRKAAPNILMATPAYLFLLIFFFIPLFYTIALSFYRWTAFSPNITFYGLKNYVLVLKDGLAMHSMKNTLVYAFSTVIIQNIIAMPIAIALTRRMRGVNFFRTIYFAPAVFSVLIVGYLWSYIFSALDTGLLNKFLLSIGLNKVNWLGDENIAMKSIITTQVWQWFGWVMVIYIANLQGIPGDIYEAAKIDGAQGLQLFRYITFPLLTPAVKVNVISGLISGLKVFDIVFAMTKGGPGHATDTILTAMFKNFSMGNFGYTSAFGSVFLVVNLLLTIMLFRLFRIWEDKIS